MSPSAASSKQLILLAEPDATVARVLTVLLEHWGHEVEVAADSTAAFAAVKRRAPALVVLDLAPSKLDGVQLARELKADRATGRIPVIAVQAPSPTVARDAIAAGCAQCLEAPLDTHRLLAAIRAALPIA